MQGSSSSAPLSMESLLSAAVTVTSKHRSWPLVPANRISRSVGCRKKHEYKITLFLTKLAHDPPTSDISLLELDQILGRSNFGHNFCLLTLLAKVMVKIGVTINLVQYHRWSKPVYCSKVGHQHIKFLAQLDKK